MKLLTRLAVARCASNWPSSQLRRVSLLLATGVSCSIAAAQTGSIVSINADKVLVVNGRKVFPITLSPGPPLNARTPAGDDALQELGEAGALMIRMAQTTDWDSMVVAQQQAMLNWAAQHSLFCMVNLRELSAFAAGDAATEAELRSVMDQFKNHPALGVWKNKDEAWWGGTSAPDLQRGYNVIRQVDVNHPVEQTHAPRGAVADLQPYNAAADIVAIDIYPVSVPPGKHSLLSNKEISMVGDWTQFLAQVANGQKQYWMIEQIAWSGVTPPNNTLIFPTLRQARFMAYQAIINGARGLMFFGGNVASTLNLRDAPLGWNWTFWDGVLEPVLREVGDHGVLTDALVAPASPLPVTMSGATAPDVEFCVREAPPYLYLLACKREGSSATVTFGGLPPSLDGGEVLFESPRTVTVQNGRFTDVFAPFDVHVYRFSEGERAPTIVFPPQSRARHPGTDASFIVTATGTGPFTYQWRKNGTDLSDGGNVAGSNSPMLTLAGVSQSDAANYDVIVSGKLGSATSSASILSVVNYQSDQTPAVTSQPQSRTNVAGTTATFSVGVSGSGPFSYQWRRNGINLSDGGHVSGARSWNLTLVNVSPFDAGNYDVVVTGFTSVTSIPPATLTVLTQADSLLLYEPFAYSNFGGPVTDNVPANWELGGTGANDLIVTADQLAAPGLAPPVGHSVSNGGAGYGVRRRFGAGVNSGLLFFSALFRVNDLGVTWNGAASQVGAFTASDNTSFRLSVLLKAGANGGYLIGVQKGGTGATATFGTAEFQAGETVLLVGKYDFTVSPNAVSLWVNPGASTMGAMAEPPGSFLAASTGTDGFSIDRFNIRQNTASSVPAAMQWDELRIGSTWSDVTPPPLPLITGLKHLPSGEFQFVYANSSGRTYSVFASVDLIGWTRIGSAVETAPGVYQFSDAEADQFERRFYQLRSP